MCGMFFPQSPKITLHFVHRMILVFLYLFFFHFPTIEFTTQSLNVQKRIFQKKLWWSTLLLNCLDVWFGMIKTAGRNNYFQWRSPPPLKIETIFQAISLFRCGASLQPGLSLTQSLTQSVTWDGPIAQKILRLSLTLLNHIFDIY